MELTEIANVPGSPGVFEIGTLVRTLLFVGAAPDSLAASLSGCLESPGQLHQQHVGRLYFRLVPTLEPDRIQAELLAEYRDRHGGALPPAQQALPSPERTARHLKAV